MFKVLRQAFLQMRSKSMEKTVAQIMIGSMWIRKKALYNYTFIFDRFFGQGIQYEYTLYSLLLF